MPASPSTKRIWPRPGHSSSAVDLEALELEGATDGAGVVRVLGLDAPDADELPGRYGLHAPLDGHVAERLEGESGGRGSSRSPGRPRWCPGSATPCRRAATLFVSPSDTAWGSAAPTRPTAVASGVDRRPSTLKSEIPQAPRLRGVASPSSVTMRSAARAARSGSSSWARREPKNGCDPVAHVGELHRAAELLHGLASCGSRTHRSGP